MARSAATWDALSAPYRRRLARAGITRARYLSGERLTGARGHAKTPERPERAVRHPERYPEYVQKREQVTVNTNAVVAHVRKLLVDAAYAGRIDRLDLFAVEEQVRALSPVLQAELLTIRSADQWTRRGGYEGYQQPPMPAKWQRFIYQDAKGRNVNPFWYHGNE